MSEGKCLNFRRCGNYLVIDTTIATGRTQPFCPQCEDAFNKNIASGRVGKKVKGKNKSIITPPLPDEGMEG